MNGKGCTAGEVFKRRVRGGGGDVELRRLREAWEKLVGWIGDENDVEGRDDEVDDEDG